jgi:hypothetical protein
MESEQMKSDQSGRPLVDEQRLKAALACRERGAVPEFERTLATAQDRWRRQKQRRAGLGGIAAALLIAALWSVLALPERSTQDYLVAESLLATTYWTAPSDVLLPRYDIDIYRDLPDLMESTEVSEGALL